MMLLMYIVACIACAQGITIEVITDLAGQDLECNSTAIISCKFPPVNTSSIRWKISTDVMNFSTVAARCEPPLSCTVNPAYNAQYSFTFDEVAGVSNVTIKRVTFEHNGIQFRCDDNFAPDFIQLNVTEPPDADTTQQENKTIGNHTILTVKTECVYPTDNISIEWYSRKTENSLLVEHRMANKTIELCDISADCIFSNKSARVESALNISEINLSNLKSSTQKSTTSYQNRVFQAVIRYGFKSIEIDFGDFPVQVTGNDCEQGTIEPIPCWKFGVIVISITLQTSIMIICILAFTKRIMLETAKHLCFLKGALIEVGIIIVVIVVIILVVRFDQKSNEDCMETFPCWAIFLITLLVFILLLLIFLLFIALEPVHDVKVLSRSTQGNSMAIKIEWSARLFYFKKFYADFESEINESFTTEMSYTSRYDGPLESLVYGLSLDNDYQAHIHSKICCLRSLRKTIVFDTKGRAWPPHSLSEEQRTESSVSLTWIPAKGHTDHYYIKYKRQKEHTDVWKVTPIIMSNHFTIHGLNSGTTYTFKIFAVNSIGHSDESSLLSVRTNAKAMLPPENFEPIEVNANDAKLSWKPSSTSKKQKFVLHYHNIAESPTGPVIDSHEIKIPYNGNTTMVYTVKGLKEGAKYSLKILTCIGKRKSHYSEAVEIQTKGESTVYNT